jgi:dGTPase
MTLRIREHLVAREAGGLAPYAMRTADSRGRARPEPEHVYRPAYQRDRDRIVHATAFRRLEYKTQVFVNEEGDYYRTRLTHTLEVAQIARTLARALGLNEDLVEAVALAHDLGHAPFGHSGGDALAACMHGHGGFEHNRQSLRVVDVLERRYPEFYGLNLTHEVRESIAKHGADERGPADDAAFEPERSPLLEAQLVDVCDAIAYDAADIDDGIRAGLLAPQDLAALPLWRRAAEAVRARHGEPGGWSGLAPSSARRLEVVATTRALIDLEATDLADETLARIERAGAGSAEDVRARPRIAGYLVAFSSEMAASKRELQGFLVERLYRHHHVMALRRKAERIIRGLFELYAAMPELLPPEWQAWCGIAGRERAVCDYIAGMTDRFAQQEYGRHFL